MESTRILAAPGIRTYVYPGWRARFGVAFASVVDRPSLWLFGILGFSLRGGILLLTLPIIALPTPVEVRLLLGDYLGTSGFSQRFWLESALFAFVAALVTLAVLGVLTRLEVAAFSRLPFVREDSAAKLSRTAFLPVLAVQFVGFLATLLACVPLMRAAIDASYVEIVRPTSSASIYERVVGSLGQELVLVGVAIVLIEIVSALTTREILVRLVRGTGPGGSHFLLVPRAFGAALVRLVRSPLRIIGTAVFGWLVSAGLLAAGLGAVILAWAGTRGVFLASVSLSDLSDDLGMGLMAIGLAAAFAAAMALTGFASALRAATWSVDRLR